VLLRSGGSLVKTEQHELEVQATEWVVLNSINSLPKRQNHTVITNFMFKHDCLLILFLCFWWMMRQSIQKERNMQIEFKRGRDARWKDGVTLEAGWDIIAYATKRWRQRQKCLYLTTGHMRPNKHTHGRSSCTKGTLSRRPSIRHIFPQFLSTY